MNKTAKAFGTMGCMSKTPGEKDLNAALPDPLWELLDGMVDDIKADSGNVFKKKHVVGAAILGFYCADAATRRALLAAVVEQFYYGRPMADLPTIREQVRQAAGLGDATDRPATPP